LSFLTGVVDNIDITEVVDDQICHDNLEDSDIPSNSSTYMLIRLTMHCFHYVSFTYI